MKAKCSTRSPACTPPSCSCRNCPRDRRIRLPSGCRTNWHPQAAVTTRAGWQFTQQHALEELQRQWHVRSAGGFGFDDDDPAVLAVGALLSYLQETQKTGLSHVRPPKRHAMDDYLAIDPASYRSLEIDRTVRTGKAEGSLLEAIDETHTPMGGRLLRQWLRYPLRDREHIEARQMAIAALIESPEALRKTTAALDDICDIERIVGRLAVGRAMPRDLAALSRCLTALPKLLDELDQLPNAAAVAPELVGPANDFARSRQIISPPPSSSIPAAHLREGGVIKPGFDAELDRLQSIGTTSQQWLVDFKVTPQHRIVHPHAEGRLQQSVRLLHRSHRFAPLENSRRLEPQADGEKTPSGTSPRN